MTEWNADQYSRGSTLQQRLARKMLMSVPLKGTEQILDVGCGDGKITAEIAAQVPQGSVLGFDLSRNMIDFASKNFTQPNLRFEVGDVCELPYREEFDLAVSFFTLHWVRAQEKALRSIRKALKENGQAWFYIVCDGPRKSIEDVIEDVRHSPDGPATIKGLKDPTYIIHRRNTGFWQNETGFIPFR
jgi:trans-aconitate 2-methyltransferase